MIPAIKSVKGGAAISAEESQKAKSIAKRLFTEIDSLENEILDSKRLASEIENRGWLKSMVSSSSKDLAAVAKTQNNINRRMVDLIQETIRLNMLSYAGLVCLMNEMRKGMESGLTDANGHIIRLGSEGRDLAETATGIIAGILDTSKGTQGRIEDHSKNIAQISQQLKVKDQLDLDQDKAIVLLTQQIEAKDKLDSQQSEAITNLEKIAKSKDELDAFQQVAIDEQKEALEKLAVQFALLNKKLSDTEAMLQQHQGETAGQLIKLGRDLQNWRWGTIALVSVPIAWQLILASR